MTSRTRFVPQLSPSIPVTFFNTQARIEAVWALLFHKGKFRSLKAFFAGDAVFPLFPLGFTRLHKPKRDFEYSPGALMGFTGIYQDSPEFTWIYRNLPRFTGIYRRDLPGFTGIYRHFLGFTGIYRDLPGFTEIYCDLPGFTGIYPDSPEFTGI